MSTTAFRSIHSDPGPFVSHRGARASASASSPIARSLESWLFIAEMEHRVANEFASAITSIFGAGAQASNAEARAALDKAGKRLQDHADAHRALQAPSSAGPIDLAEYLRRLCRALVRASLAERGIRLTLVEQSIDVEADRCWRVGLIVSELITNAMKHAFRGLGGSIVVELSVIEGNVRCRVADNGHAGRDIMAGCGSHIIEALAADLSGQIERQSSVQGTTVALLFPQNPTASGPRSWKEDRAI